ncbi:MAG: mismatch-specific DNA-glycosylase [Rhodospirillales bacterium]
MPHALPDVLQPGLKVVFCGSAVGPESFRRKKYYAHPRNRFWPTLHAVELLPPGLGACEYKRVVEFGIGLTDLAKNRHGVDAVLVSADYDAEALEKNILRHRPCVLAFTGKKPGEAFFRRRFKRRVNAYGRQPERIGATALFVLTSPSPANAGHWDIGPWRELAAYVRSL